MQKAREWPSLLAVAAALIAGACHYSNDVIPQDSDAPAQLLTANINNSAFRAQASVSASYKNEVLTVMGGDGDAQRVTITLYNIDRSGSWPRTFRLDLPGVSNVGFAQYTEPYSLTSYRFYSTAAARGVGSVTITAFSPTKVEGTFSFVAQLTEGVGAVLVNVTDGMFAAPVK